jgi:hypothetical protein
VCGRIVVGQVREKVVQWTESNVTASYFSKELQAEVDRLARLQGRGLLRQRSACPYERVTPPIFTCAVDFFPVKVKLLKGKPFQEDAL